jgi:hypothetical protein
LYSQLSHLKKGSIKVAEGDYVKKGQVLALVGNSGRSPYPHLHVQFQSTQFIGSQTLYYPFAYYMINKDKSADLQKFGFPEEDQNISNALTLELLRKTFQFKPGQRITAEIEESHFLKVKQSFFEWQIQTTAYNVPYLYCPETKSYAYFEKDDQRLMFFDFEGDTSSLLYKFFLSFYNIHWVYFPDFKLTDSIPANYLVNKKLLFFHDFIAPFKSFINIEFKANYLKYNDDFTDESLLLETEIVVKSKLSGQHPIKNKILIHANGEIEWNWQQNNKKIKVKIRTK